MKAEINTIAGKRYAVITLACGAHLRQEIREAAKRLIELKAQDHQQAQQQ